MKIEADIGREIDLNAIHVQHTAYFRAYGPRLAPPWEYLIYALSDILI